MKTFKKYGHQFLVILSMIHQLLIRNVSTRIGMIPLLILMFGLVSCDWESELEIEDIDVPSRLVMNSILFLQNDTNRIYFSDSKPIFSTGNSTHNPAVYYLRDVQTSFYKNGNLQTGIFSDPKDSITYYVDNQIKAGDAFSIEAMEGGRKITASTIIPAQPQIISIDTMSFRLNISSGNSYSYTDNLRLLIKIKDQPEVNNYYRIFINTESEIRLDPTYAKNTNVPEVIKTASIYLDSDDPAITNGNPKNNFNSDFALNEFPQNYYNIFTDDLFKNGEYTLNVYTIAPYATTAGRFYTYLDSQYVLEYKEKITLRLQALSPELYQYYNSLQKYLYNNEDVIEPYRVYNNINGGMGIFGSINQLTYVVFEKHVIN